MYSSIDSAVCKRLHVGISLTWKREKVEGELVRLYKCRRSVPFKFAAYRQPNYHCTVSVASRPVNPRSSLLDEPPATLLVRDSSYLFATPAVEFVA